MIPYDPSRPHVVWFEAWRGHIQKAKAHPHVQPMYCLAAMIAQGQYVQYLALELARKKQ